MGQAKNDSDYIYTIAQCAKNVNTTNYSFLFIYFFYS